MLPQSRTLHAGLSAGVIHGRRSCPSPERSPRPGGCRSTAWRLRAEVVAEKWMWLSDAVSRGDRTVADGSALSKALRATSETHSSSSPRWVSHVVTNACTPAATGRRRAAVLSGRPEPGDVRAPGPPQACRGLPVTSSRCIGEDPAQNAPGRGWLRAEDRPGVHN